MYKTLLLLLLTTGIAMADDDVTTASKRAAFFDDFTIKGAGGTQDIESAAAHGANVIRTWSIGDGTHEMLDRAQDLGMKVILGVWLPDPHDAEEYRIKGRWQVDYTKKQSEYTDKMQDLLDEYDDHPALLMWGLGNEVEYSVSFLETINEMSKIVHQHNPQRLTTHVSVNANQIELFAERASDIDVYGANSYGDGSMNNVAQILEKEWGKKYFFSEYSYHGPWSVKKTATGYPMEFPPVEKVKRLKQTFGVFEKHDNLVGGVFFIWGQFSANTGTWFNGLLPRDPGKDKDAEDSQSYLTPYTDALHAYWTGEEVDNHAPVIKSASINGAYGLNVALEAGSKSVVAVGATDAENNEIRYSYWIFTTRNDKRGKLLGGLTDGAAQAALAAPTEPGSYTLLVYAVDAAGKASSHQVPFTVLP